VSIGIVSFSPAPAFPDLRCGSRAMGFAAGTYMWIDFGTNWDEYRSPYAQVITLPALQRRGAQ